MKHNDFRYNNPRNKSASFPYLNCSGCSLAGPSVPDMLTIATSHEIRESVTDSLSNAWHDAPGYEADDQRASHNLYSERPDAPVQPDEVTTQVGGDPRAHWHLYPDGWRPRASTLTHALWTACGDLVRRDGELRPCVECGR